MRQALVADMIAIVGSLDTVMERSTGEYYEDVQEIKAQYPNWRPRRCRCGSRKETRLPLGGGAA
jgi:hypothetical protein